MKILGRKLSLPRSMFLRRFVGCFLVTGGLLGFLPILGFWMLPVGLVVLSHDSSRIRRFRRRSDILLMRYWQASRFSRKTGRIGKKAKVAMRAT